MTPEAMRCLDCGATWYSTPATRASAANGGCLRCGGRLVPVGEAESMPESPDLESGPVDVPDE
jgi:hypothetical protein